MTPLDQRLRYQSGGVAWTRLPWLLLAPFASLVAAYLLFFSFKHGFYILFLAPLFAALGLAAAVYGLVTAAHLRNRWLAGAVGYFVGLTGHLGYYQFSLNAHAPGAAWRVDLLPAYIVLRVRHDVAVDLARGDKGVEPEPFVPLNFLTFAAELFIMTLAPAAAGFSRAGRAYCPELRRWMIQETRPFPHGAGAHLMRALEDGTVPDFIAAIREARNVQMGCVCVLEYGEDPYFSLLDHAVYMTLSEMAVPKGRRTAPRMGRLLRQVMLEPAEVVALRPLFPQLNRQLEPK